LHFVYSSCTPSMPLSIFIFFSNFHIFSSFPLLLEQLPHSTTMLLYPCMGLMTITLTSLQSTCDLGCVHHYIFHLLPVSIYVRVFPLCFHYLIFDYALVFFTRQSINQSKLFVTRAMSCTSSNLRRVFSPLSFHTHTLG